MAVTPTFLPFLPRAPYQTPMVDPKTGLVSTGWTRWLQNLEAVFAGVWTNVPFNSANFGTELGVWSIAASNIVQFATFQLGQFAAVIFTAETTTFSLDSAYVTIAVPTLKMVVPTGSAFVNDAFTAICTLFIDGAGEPGYAVLNNVTSGGVTTVQIVAQRLSGADFPAVALSVQISLIMLVQCQNVIVTT